MQQFASTQTSIAASNIAFDEIQVNPALSRASSGANEQQSQQRSAFEDALARQEQKSTSQADRQADSQAEKARQNERDLSKRSANSETQNSTAQRSQESRERARDQQLRNENKQEQIQAERKANADKRENNQVQARDAKKSDVEANTQDNAQTNAQANKSDNEAHCENCHHDEAATASGAQVTKSITESEPVRENLVPASEQLDADSQAATLEELRSEKDPTVEVEVDEKVISGDVSAEQKLNEEFDWVSYVNQVKDLSSKELEQVSQDLALSQELDNKALNSEDFFAKALESMKAQESAELNPQDSANIVNSENNNELVEINLSEQELSALLEAAGLNAQQVQESLSLNSEKLENLDKAIASLLNQLLDKKAEKSDVDDAAVQSELDVNLLKNLLGTHTDGANAEQKVPMPLEESAVKNDVWQAQNDALESTLTANPDATQIDDQIEPKPLDETVKDIQIQSQKIAEGIKGTESVLIPEAAIKADKLELNEIEATLTALPNTGQTLGKNVPKDAELALAKLNLPLSASNESAKKNIELLAKLSPEAEQASLENVSQRVEAVISDLKAEGKATEFIAALQSGVKEMKEQLKAGREPGIDLKSLVSDALIAADVKIAKSAEPKLEQQLNQLNTILSAANSINQNAQQQNYLNTGLPEAQGMKEIAQLQVESSKLVQQTVVNEKAVNIFKPEGQQQLTEKVRWMVNSKNLSAEIRLDPPDLGGMNIKVNLSGDSASVSFVVQSQQARDALDQAVPRLREMLEEQGIELGQSSVEQDGSGQGQQGQNGEQHIANNSMGSGNLAQQSQDQSEGGTQGMNAQEDGEQGDLIGEQRISGSQIGGIDYYV